MHPKTKRNPKGAGRKPTFPPRDRRNLNIERTFDFDNRLMSIRQQLASHRGVELSKVTQTEAVQIAVTFYAISGGIALDSGKEICPRCNGVGYIAIKNGDDDDICECCGQEINTGEIPF